MVDDGIVGQATHVFCMTRGHLDALEGLYPEERDKFHLVCDFSEIEGEVGRDVPDPIGGGLQTYEEVAACLDQAIEGILGCGGRSSSRKNKDLNLFYRLRFVARAVTDCLS
jgi:protein-tyrosine-phosphatase